MKGNLKSTRNKLNKIYAEKYNLKNYYIHTPYYINLASANNRIYYSSISAIKEELEKADLIGAKAVITHLGSARELEAKEAEKKLIRGLVKIFNPPAPLIRGEQYCFSKSRRVPGKLWEILLKKLPILSKKLRKKFLKTV